MRLKLLTLIDRRALEIAADVVASSTDAYGAASFEEFGAWYNGGGNELIPWIELLDLKKWPFSSPAVAESAGAMLEFPLSSDGDDTLRIQQQDIDDLQVILSRTQLHTAEVETLH